eukprot:11167398-Lingulodinium_polyedra.AAC.1
MALKRVRATPQSALFAQRFVILAATRARVVRLKSLCAEVEGVRVRLRARGQPVLVAMFRLGIGGGG